MKLPSLYSVLSSITVEPLALLFYTSGGFQSATDNALWYRKVCLSLYGNDGDHGNWVCDNLAVNETLTEQEEHVQRVNSEWNFYKAVCFSVPQLLTTFLYGSWSDVISRKLPMVIPLVGNVLGNAVYMAGAIFMDSPLGFLLLAGLLQGSTGNLATILMAMMSYVSDVSTKHSTTSRIAIVYATGSLGTIISFTLSGVLLEYTGFVTIYSICIILNLIAIVYVIFGFPDIKRGGSRKTKQIADEKKIDSEKEVDESEQNSETNKDVVQELEVGDSVGNGTEEDVKDTGEKRNCSNRCSKFFNTKDVKDVAMVALKKRPDNHRAHLIVIISVVLFFLLGNPVSISYLYLFHPPLSFTQRLYGFYIGYCTIINCTYNFLGVPLLKKKLGIADTKLLIIALASSVGMNLFMGLSVKPWMVFLAPLLGFMAYGIYIFARGIISQLVPAEDFGKVFATLAVLENVGVILSEAIYAYFLYPKTVGSFAGFSFIFGAILQTVPVGLSIWLFIDLKKYSKHIHLDESERENPCYDMDVNGTVPEDKDTC